MKTELLDQETALLDAAFSFAKQIGPSLSETLAKSKLRRAFPHLPPEQIEECYRRAVALARGCYDAAEECRDGRLNETEALAWMRQNHPGFSEEIYDSALNLGYFLSR